MTLSTERGKAQISAGRVGRPHGLDGGFHVSAPRSRLLETGICVQIGERTLKIARRGGTAERPILHLEGVGDRDALAVLRGLEIKVSVEQAPSLQEDEWWAHELEGCRVSDGQREVGTVARLLELPSCEVLEVSREREQALLVPMVKDAIRNVDMERRQIDIDLAFLGEQA